jgi:hypothetical protein
MVLIIRYRSENNAPHNLKGISLVEGIPYSENPANKLMHIELDDWMDSAYSKKVR